MIYLHKMGILLSLHKTQNTSVDNDKNILLWLCIGWTLDIVLCVIYYNMYSLTAEHDGLVGGVYLLFNCSMSSMKSSF